MEILRVSRLPALITEFHQGLAQEIAVLVALPLDEMIEGDVRRKTDAEFLVTRRCLNEFVVTGHISSLQSSADELNIQASRV